MTVAKCAAFCSGYAFMAVEYSTECYCGNKINIAQGASVAVDGRCKMPCGGDSSTICGGSYGLSVYTAGTLPPYVGCAVDQSARTLNGPVLSSSSMTVEKCVAFCGTNYPLAGLEYGTECYCGGPAVTIGASGCSSKCGGNKDQSCGGSWRLSVYNNTAYVPPVLGKAISGYNYKGCFVDNLAGRVLNSYVTASSTMTQEMCVSTCKSRGLNVAGVEYGKECWCGKTVPTMEAPESDCNMKCAGDDRQSCGAGVRLNVWAA